MQERKVNENWVLDIGASILNDGKTAVFNVWAPKVSNLELLLYKKGIQTTLKMEKDDATGYHTLTTDSEEGIRYFYLLDHEKRRADPVSKFQPEGIHGPSEIIGDSFEWHDTNWTGISVENLIIYELHVGTYSAQGTFDSLIPYIDYLTKDLGVTAIELMPIAQFPGGRNWGYDGVFMFSPQNTYGGPEALKHLIDACHSKGLAVILDVVYNHVGPEGNYLQDFGPYFSYKYHTPWGPSFNYDDKGCDNVRKYIISNALYWITDYHFDGLRLDAIHGIFDFSPKHILEEIKDSVEFQAKRLGRTVSIIAESDLNDPRIVRPKEKCGYGLDAQWSDDFHHAIHAFLTGEKFGYYQDFGCFEDVVKCLTCNFVYDGKYSRFRGKKHGAIASDIPGNKFVVCLQNHDQVGNRPDGSRLGLLLKDIRLVKLAAGLLILSPFTPLLFMGEEFGEIAPFYYFTSHSDEDLVKAVREGRKNEFESHNWLTEYVDPQDKQTFARSKVNHDLRLQNGSNRELFSYYCDLIRLRKLHRALKCFEKNSIKVKSYKEQALVIHRNCDFEKLMLVYNFGPDRVEILLSSGEERWKKIHDSNSFSPSSDKLLDLAPEILTNRDGFPPFTFAVYSLQC